MEKIINIDSGYMLSSFGILYKDGKARRILSKRGVGSRKFGRKLILFKEKYLFLHHEKSKEDHEN